MRVEFWWLKKVVNITNSCFWPRNTAPQAVFFSDGQGKHIRQTGQFSMVYSTKFCEPLNIRYYILPLCTYVLGSWIKSHEILFDFPADILLPKQQPTFPWGSPWLQQVRLPQNWESIRDCMPFMWGCIVSAPQKSGDQARKGQLLIFSIGKVAPTSSADRQLKLTK